MSREHVGIPEHVVRREIGDETVILNLRTGRYHGLDAVGGRMLTLLGEGMALGDVARTVAEEYGEAPERVRGDLDELCHKLAERGLVVRDG